VIAYQREQNYAVDLKWTKSSQVTFI